jgi:hypothetical protein
VASKKEPKAKAKKERVAKDDAGEAEAASKKPKPRKLQKKATAKDGSGKGGSKRDSANHHKIRVPVTVQKKETGGTTGKELDPFEIAKQRVKGSVPAIVDAMVAKAKQGSCTHAKTLLEMTGARHMFDSEGEARDSGEPWAKLVLERLDEADSETGRESTKLHAEEQEVAAGQ